MDRSRQFYIDGAWVDPVDGTAFEVIDPAHETVIETISLGGRADVERAVVAARAAFPSWSLSTPAERMAVLERGGAAGVLDVLVAEDDTFIRVTCLGF